MRQVSSNIVAPLMHQIATFTDALLQTDTLCLQLYFQLLFLQDYRWTHEFCAICCSPLYLPVLFLGGDTTKDG